MLLCHRPDTLLCHSRAPTRNPKSLTTRQRRHSRRILAGIQRLKDSLAIIAILAIKIQRSVSAGFQTKSNPAGFHSSSPVRLHFIWNLTGTSCYSTFHNAFSCFSFFCAFRVSEPQIKTDKSRLRRFYLSASSLKICEHLRFRHFYRKKRFTGNYSNYGYGFTTN